MSEDFTIRIFSFNNTAPDCPSYRTLGALPLRPRPTMKSTVRLYLQCFRTLAAILSRRTVLVHRYVFAASPDFLQNEKGLVV